MKYNFHVANHGNQASQSFDEVDSKKGWVKYGQDDDYVNYLNDLFVGSSIHSAVCKGVSDMIYGGGLKADEPGHADMVKVIGLFGGDVLRRAALDLKLYGQCYLNPIWSVDRSTIAEVHHLPVANVRCGVAEDDVVTKYYYATNWGSQVVPKVIPAFSAEDRTAASTVIQIKLYSPVGFYYGIPDYIGSTAYIDVDIEVGDFHLANIQNSLFPSCMINFHNGIPTEEERRTLEEEINRKFQGAQSAGKTLITWNDSKEETPTFQAFQPSEPQRVYQFLSKEVVTKILSGHRVTSPLIFGVRGEGGGFGSNADEMRDAYELFQNSVVQSFQDTLLSGLSPILHACGVTIPLHFEKLAPAKFLWSDGFGGEGPAQEEVERREMSSDLRISEVQGKAWMVHLASKNSPMKGWKLWREMPVSDTSLERSLHSPRQDFASAGELEDYDNHQLPSEWGDAVNGDNRFALRYAYEPLDSTTISKTGKSRDFCQTMVSLSEAGVMYRYEDIADMSDNGINDEFAPAGASSYDIFEHKGGVNCYHTWLRKIFIQTDNNLSEAELEASWDEVMRSVGNNPYVPPKGEESIAPIDTPSRGSLK